MIIYDTTVCTVSSRPNIVLLHSALPVTDIFVSHSDDGGLVTRLASKDAVGDALDRLRRDLVNLIAHLGNGNFAVVHQELRSQLTKDRKTYVG